MLYARFARRKDGYGLQSIPVHVFRALLRLGIALPNMEAHNANCEERIPMQSKLVTNIKFFLQ